MREVERGSVLGRKSSTEFASQNGQGAGAEWVSNQSGTVRYTAYCMEYRG